MDDGRKHQRCSVHWRSAISIVGNNGPQTLQCKTNDVSAGGVSVICPLNIFPGRELTVFLLIDPGSPTHPQVVFEAQGKVMNTVLSSHQGGFRLGIEFTKFAGDSKQLLKSHLPKDVVKPARLVTAGGTASPAALAPAAETPASAAEQPGAGEPAAATDETVPAEGVATAAEAGEGEAAAATGAASPEGETPAQA